MSPPSLKCLLVEDSPSDKLLIESALEMVMQTRVSMAHAETLADALRILREQDFSAVLLDLGLPDSEGIETLERLRKASPRVPIVVVTGLADETIAVSALQAGAQDYVVKGKVTDEELARVVRYAVERARAGEHLRRSEERFALLVDGVRDYAIIMLDPDGRVVSWNVGAERIFGYKAVEVIGDLVSRFYPAEDLAADRPGQVLRRASVEGRAAEEGWRTRKGGERFWSESIVTALRDQDWRLLGFAKVIRDLTEKKAAQDALQEKAALAALSADVSLALIQSISLEAALQRCTDAMVRHLNCAFARIWSLDPAKQMLLLRASSGMYTHLDGPHSRVPVGKFKIGLIAQERAPHLTNDVQHDPRIGDPEWARREKMVAFAGYPLLVEDDLVGVMGMFSRGPFSNFELDALGTVATTIALGMRRKQGEIRETDLQRQLLQSQKMEAIGRLAGGIAHDFNNLLGVVLGYADLVKRRLDPGSPAIVMMDEIHKAADRAAALTRQLLAFSRRSVFEIQVLNLNRLVEDYASMLQRVIGEDIELGIDLHPDLGLVKADPMQLGQVLLNLAVNARDALPRGGTFRVQTANVQLDAGYTATHPEVEPGAFVMLLVADTGTGMDRETQARVFEPFFTTKEQGKGTGLGLATVYGIVRQSKGSIWLYSEPGKGTVFKIYLPRVEERAVRETQPQAPRDLSVLGGSETVLVVEDEEMVRGVTVSLLEQSGYRVLTAENGVEALERFRERPDEIDLVISDLIMPKMGGTEMATAMAAIRPDIRVIFMSGYTEEDLEAASRRMPHSAFLSKPFNTEDLLGKVRELLQKPSE